MRQPPTTPSAPGHAGPDHLHLATTAGAVDPALLASIAEIAEGAADPDHDDGPVLVRLRPGAREVDGELELGVRTMGAGVHPAEELAGFVAPADWVALAVSCTGTARDLDDRHAVGRVRSTFAVARSGAWAHRLQPLDEAAGERVTPTSSSGTAKEADEAIGWIPDLVRRCLGVPTPPPPEGTTAVWVALWLLALLEFGDRASNRRRLRRWHVLAELHPAVALLRPPEVPATPAALAGLARQLADEITWSSLRQRCQHWRLGPFGLDPALVGWLDDGAFARWVLGQVPDLTALRLSLASVLLPSATADVEAVLQEVIEEP